MFAVLKTGGKQYKVSSGDTLRVEKLAALPGDKIQFNEILMVGASVGTPMISGAAVQAEVIDQIKGEKVIHFAKRRRKHSSKRTKGHRQQLTLLRITDILEKGGEKTGVKAAVGTGSLNAAERAALQPVTGPAAKKPDAKSGAPKKPVAKKAEAKNTEAKKTEAKKPEAKAAAKPAAPKKPAEAKTAAKSAAKSDDLKLLSGVG
ncbi:MAG: 50S ribosomal protein L21, partial [Halocynthiibacter sp.]